MMGHWARISGKVLKWSSAMDEAQRRMNKRSGYNDDDLINEANAIYVATDKSGFNLINCWNLLKKYPKWQVMVKSSIGVPLSASESQQLSSDSGKRSRGDEPVESDEVMGSSNRPQGIKAAKKIKVRN